MKNFLFFSAFILYSVVGLCTTTTIVNSGYTFSPASVTITLGNDVNFVLASIHDAVEVSQATWNANGTTPLSGGFSTAFGGGMVAASMLTVGTHYYVCTAHASMGMKGVIMVQNATGIAENQLQTNISVYPNPSSEQFTIANLYPSSDGYDIEIYNIVGEKVYSDKMVRRASYIVHSDWLSGIYFVQIKTGEGTLVKKIIISN